MALPQLTAQGILPEGIYDATMPEVEERFGRRGDRRMDLFAKLSAFHKLLVSAGIFSELYVDGSFVTDKPSPGDVDVLIPIDDPKPMLALPQ